jgi:ABC-2 type transport system ATP-binding protein
VAGRALQRKLQWLDRHLRGRAAVDTGPAFEWVDEAGRWDASDGYPLKDAGTVRGRGSGTLALVPGENPLSGLLIAATPDPLALRVAIDAPPAGADVVGEPTLTATYRATGAGLLPGRRTYVYAQLVDRARNVVVNNLATPVPITLDGARHTVSLDLERIASRATAAGYRLEVSPQSTVYDVQRAAGAIRFESVEVTLPLAAPVTEPELTLTRRCLPGGGLLVRLAGQVEQVRAVSFRFDRRVVARDTRAAFGRTLSRRTLRSTRARRLRALVTVRDGDPPRMVLARTLPRCG